MSIFDKNGKVTIKQGQIQGDLTKLSKKELLGLVQNMAHDWAKLNSIHNRRARAEEWCSWYEGNQAAYNKRFRVLQLKARSNRVLNRPPYGGKWTSPFHRRHLGHSPEEHL